MKNLFTILPADFFKPLTSKYRREYADCILLIFNTYKTEISYGVDREIVVQTLSQYFEADDSEMRFEEESAPVRDARDKANAVIAALRACGWIEYEQETDHTIRVVLFPYAVPVIESMNRVIREEEAEYQGIISQIHACLQNQDLYRRPYELIIKGVEENTERLLSELKKLSASIKRHMDQQTAEMDAAQILDHFFDYHKKIGSKAYMRMKTSENISYFRNSIIEKIDEILSTQEIMDRAVEGYQEIEQVSDPNEAYDCVVGILLDVKASFYRLDEIIEEIDQKHTRYIRGAVMRANFLLSSGNHAAGRIEKILADLADELNAEGGQAGIEPASEELQRLFALYPQRYLSQESLRTIPVVRKPGEIGRLPAERVMNAKERELYMESLREKNRRRFTRKKIDAFVLEQLGERMQMSVEELPADTRRDLIRIIYISIYAGYGANHYRICRNGKRVRMGGFTLPYFDIVRK
jgi:hypothetical protein